MKTRKAVKRIEKVESMLKLVMEEYSQLEPGPRQLLDSAKELATRARTKMVQPSAKQPSETSESSKVTPRKGPGKSVPKTDSLAEVG